jgi:hypothetical protein
VKRTSSTLANLSVAAPEVQEAVKNAQNRRYAFLFFYAILAGPWLVYSFLNLMLRRRREGQQVKGCQQERTPNYNQND